MTHDRSRNREMEQIRQRVSTDRIRLAGADDLAAIAAIHHGSGTPGLLSDLGLAFLERVYYRGILDSPIAETYVIELGDAPAGVVSLTTDADGLFTQVFRRRLPLAARLAIGATARRPRLLGDLLETVLDVRRNPLGSGINAEIISLQVARRYQGLGLGLFLLQRATDRLMQRGAVPFKSRMLASNTAVTHLYAFLGFNMAGSYPLHGRTWEMWVHDGRDIGTKR
jgi:GNAT superfamily N-acetyltransferase